METVKDLLRQKGHAVWSISPSASVYDALKLMAEKGIGALVVLEDRQVVGVLSERDYARKVVLEGKSEGNTPVKEIMTARVLYIRPDETVDECMALMTEKRVRHLPVLDKGQLVGLISIGDVVKAVIEKKDFLIKQLEQYITGTSA